MRTSLAALLFLLAGWSPVAAQDQTGRIVGRIIDARTGQGLAQVAIQIVGLPAGTHAGAISGVDGRYTLGTVRAGTVTMYVRRLGFQPKTVTGIYVNAGQVVTQDISLAASTVTLEGVTVNAAKEAGSVHAALDAQRTARGVVNTVSAEQIAKSPDGDAAQAVQRVSGVSVQDGKYVFVRGLGERYTTTSLNGARMPSPEPERKVVPLDLFPAGLLQSITTSKTFTADQPGDFSGGAVDIRTREFPGKRSFTYGASSGMNTVAGGRALPFAPGVGGEQFAFARRARWMPGYVHAVGDLATSSQEQQNRIVNAFRDVWRTGSRGGRPNSAVSASLGGSDPVLGHRFGYLLSGTYSYTQEIRQGEQRAVAQVGDGGLREINRFDGTTGRASALWGALANASTMLGRSTRLSLNNTYTRTADNDARTERGTYEDLGLPVAIERLDYVERRVWSSQLAGQTTRGRHQLDWSATTSGVTRDQPDRSEFVTEIRRHDATGTERQLWLNTLPEGAVRSFATLGERAHEARLDYTLSLGRADWISAKAGVLGRRVTRDADVRSFGVFARALADAVRALPPETLFGGAFTAPDSARLQVRSLAQGGAYAASDALGAGYAMLDVAPTLRFRMVAGARVEQSRVRVDATSTLRERSVARRDFTDVLPSLSLTFKPTDAQNLRVALTRTLARPEYRELAGLRTRDVLGGVDVRGNPTLVRTLIDNADLRWEWFPSAGEVVSAGLFAKRFRDPIERVFRASNTNSLLTFVNAESADDLGLELEVRKELGFLAGALDGFSTFANVTLMRSRIHLGGDETAVTSTDRAMMGQAPYVINTGIAWTDESGRASATLLFNRVGARITQAGEKPLPDVRELPRNVLDFSLRAPVGRAFALRLDARNLLDAPYVIEQGTIVREGWRAGRTVGVGATFTP